MSTVVGGLSADIQLDVTKALKQLQLLEAQMKKVLTPAAGVNTAATSLNKTSVAAKTTSKSLGTLNSTAQTTKNSLTQLGQAAVIGTANPLYAVSQASRGLTTALSGVGAATGVAGVGLAVFAAGAVAATIAVGALAVASFKLASAGIQSSKEIERLSLSLEAMLGSATAAKNEVAALQAIAIESPFQTATIINLDKFLISQGVAAGQLRTGLVSGVLDLAAALGLADQNVQGITYALAQVQARGYLSGDELRQLANQYIPVWDALRELPSLAAKSNAELRKTVETGAVSSTDFFEALIAYAERYESAAARAALTTEGLIDKMKDLTFFSIGQSFIQVEDVEGAVGPLEVIRTLLYQITQVLQQIDWRPFAAAVGFLMDSFIGPISAFIGNQGNLIIGFFESWLPNAIVNTTKALRLIGSVFKILWDIAVATLGGLASALVELIRVVVQVVADWSELWQFAGIILGAFVVVSIGSVGVLAGALQALIGVVQLVVAAFGSLYKALSGDIAGAMQSWNDSVAGAQTAVRGVAAAITAPAAAVRSSIGAFTDLRAALDGLGDIELPDFGDLAKGAEELQTVAGATDSIVGAPSSDSGGGGGSGSTASTVAEIEKAMDALYDLVARWNGLRSELEEGFLGKEGFEATVDQMLTMGQKLVEALTVVGADDAVQRVTDLTFQMIALAEARTVLAEKLKDAEAELGALIQERDSFTAAIRKSALSFAAALKLEENTVEQWEMVSERGFFYRTETKETKSFVDSLRERSQALTDFFTNIKALQAQGLDARFLQELLTAGPAQSGEVAAALAAGGAEMVNEVNVLYDGISETADALADFGAEQFHDAGIAQAEALVDGLNADLEIVEAAAIVLTDAIYAAVEPFAKEMEETGAAGSQGMAAGIASGIGAVGGSMGKMSDTITDSTAIMEHKLSQTGTAIGDTLETDTEGWLKTFDEFAAEFETKVGGFADDIVGELENLKFDINLDGDVNVAALRYKFFDALLKMFQDIPVALRLFLFGGPTYYAIERALSSMRGGSSGGRITGGAERSLSAYAMSSFASARIGEDGSGYSGSSTTGFGVQSQDALFEPTVNVFIGDEELRGIVRTEVVTNEQGQVSRILTGRRV